VFVDRARRHQSGQAVGEIVKRLDGGTSVVLFAEGTSSDGNRVLPFRSALLGAVEEAVTRAGDASKVLIQPMSISYTGINGIPMTYLLDGEGKIVATNLRGEDLDAAVAKILLKP
jgi:1-acyl-sn-glycerol-3-phosphate acyltransferase